MLETLAAKYIKVRFPSILIMPAKRKSKSKKDVEITNFDLYKKWENMPLKTRVKLLAQIGYKFDQESLDFHNAGLMFVHELTVDDTKKLMKLVYGPGKFKVGVYPEGHPNQEFR